MLTMPLDALDLRHVGLLKIDVEGAEYEVIQGATQTLTRERPIVVIEENVCSRRYGREPEDARRLLEAMGMVESSFHRHDGERRSSWRWL